MILLFLSLCSSALFSQDSVRIYGQVTDFNGVAIDSVSVRLKNKDFVNLYETVTDKNGNYSLTVLKNSYYCLYAIRLVDYAKTKLEYWAWNIPAFHDLEINPKYERMEVYIMNAFEPQVSPHETYMVYFRPMSLTKSHKLEGKRDVKEVEKTAIANKGVMDIAPEAITTEELTVHINGQKSEVVGINKVKEYARGAFMYGYLIQIKKPTGTNYLYDDYDLISIQLHSEETDEYGMGECFVKRIR